MGIDLNCILVVKDEAWLLLVVGRDEVLVSSGGQEGGGLFVG